MKIPKDPRWSVIYAKAIHDDGSLFFPERLTHEFLQEARRTMGTYLFSNQYLNEIIPDGSQPFQRTWLKYYQQLPQIKNTFAFIDPAISQSDDADYTAVTVIDVDADQTWYLKYAKRFKITPTQIVTLMFNLQKEFQCQGIGVEIVAYQKALLYMLDEEMKRRGTILPVKGINPGVAKSKETRIMGLVPRFEWGRILIAQGLHDFETEYGTFPRGGHDDLLDALSQLEQIVYYPQRENRNDRPAPGTNEHEKWYLQQLAQGRDPRQSFERTEY